LFLKGELHIVLAVNGNKTLQCTPKGGLTFLLIPSWTVVRTVLVVYLACKFIPYFFINSHGRILMFGVLGNNFYVFTGIDTERQYEFREIRGYSTNINESRLIANWKGAECMDKTIIFSS